jgi:hypothetical protein
VALCLETSRDLNGLCEISFVGDLDDVSPAALEVFGEHWRHIFDLGWAWSRWALILWLQRNRFLASFSNQLAADGFTLNSSIEGTEDATAVAELSRVSVWINLTLHPRSLLGHIWLIIVVQVVTDAVFLVIRSLIRTFDQIVLNDLRDFWQRVVSFENWQRLRQELQSLISYQFTAGETKKIELRFGDATRSRFCLDDLHMQLLELGYATYNG